MQNLYEAAKVKKKSTFVIILTDINFYMFNTLRVILINVWNDI